MCWIGRGQGERAVWSLGILKHFILEEAVKRQESFTFVKSVIFVALNGLFSAVFKTQTQRGPVSAPHHWD